jgi:hypothetical protein
MGYNHFICFQASPFSVAKTSVQTIEAFRCPIAFTLYCPSALQWQQAVLSYIESLLSEKL